MHVKFNQLLLVFIGGLLLSGMLHAETPTPEKEWTFLTFMNGNNSLDKYTPENLNQMEMVGSTDKINVVVQWASLARKTAVRMLMIKDNLSNKITSPVVENLGLVDMGDYHTLVDFIRWGVLNYPAKHYFINVWNHGSGWHNITLGNIKPYDISWDDLSKHVITTKELAIAMSEAAKIIGHKVDIYGSDACTMGMIEIAYQMSDAVEIYTGSEQLEPGPGWPYKLFLTGWAAAPNSSAIEVTKILSKSFIEEYSKGPYKDEGATFSAFDLSKVEDVVQSVASLSASILALNPVDRTAVYKSVVKTLKFSSAKDYGDLGDLVNNLESNNYSKFNPQIFPQIKSAMKAFVVANGTTKQYARANGISIWMPIYYGYIIDLLKSYKTHKFDQQTNWGDALFYMIGK